MTNNKIAILGGDLRQLALALCLARAGYDVHIWGIPENARAERFYSATHPYFFSHDWRNCISGAYAVLLPLPASVDGESVSCPLYEATDSKTHEGYLSFNDVISAVTDKHTLLLGGKCGTFLPRLAAEHKVRFIDYYECEELQIKNAIPTAEGALAIAMKELSVTIKESRVSVLGYGRVGRCVAGIMTSLGAYVTVAARAQHDLAWAYADGCHPSLLSDYLAAPPTCDLIINTIPACLLDETVLSRLSPSTVIIDLSSPAGLDYAFAAAHGIRAIRALSLPGKAAPFSAGRIISETVIRLMKEATQ